MTEIMTTCITCGTLIPRGQSRCSRHRSKSSSSWARYAAKYPDQAAYYHSQHWRDRRASQLREHPTCIVCGAKANHVDHVIPIAEGGRLDGELQSLCREHHKAKTQAESKQGNRRAAARRRQRG
jgi:5-methylcytosine-specific restriction enzyme A